MVLEKITYDQVSEHYIESIIDDESWSISKKLYEDGVLKKTTIENYSKNFISLLNIEIREDNSKTIEIYTNDRLSDKSIFEYDKLTVIEGYIYDRNFRLSEVKRFNSSNELLYRDLYFRSDDGSLRKLQRSISDGFYMHWFYKNGSIVESWLVEGEKTTRTEFNIDGTLKIITVFGNKKEESSEYFEYWSNGKVKYSEKSFGDIIEKKDFNKNGLKIKHNILENGIVSKYNQYEYSQELLTKEIITGHGLKEHNIYNRDESGDLTSIEYYIKDILKRVRIFESDESEIIEYYKDKLIYLKEFYFEGEKIKKDLYHNGKLFKSESFSE
jgi:hypothetical protein